LGNHSSILLWWLTQFGVGGRVKLISILSDGLLPLVHKEFLQMYGFPSKIYFIILFNNLLTTDVSAVRLPSLTGKGQ